MNGEAGAIIRADKLTKRFPGTVAVKDASFTVQRAELFGFVGPDGAGKTTIMRMLAAVMKPDEGELRLEGIDAVARPEEMRRRLSYMPQRFGLYEDLTVDENIRFYADVFEVPRKLREERSTRLLTASGMHDFRNRLAGQLSGGMKQKLGLTCALIHAPNIVLLDEPTTGVDPVSRRDFWRILHGLRAQGVTIVISTAYLDEAERCTRLALLHRGEIRHCEAPDALRRKLPGQMIVVACDTPRLAAEIVSGVAGVLTVRAVGDAARAMVDDRTLRIPEIERALVANGIPRAKVEGASTTVEDVFLALLEREGRES
jgi:ABC-2 type transport system ATP-binding protein